MEDYESSHSSEEESEREISGEQSEEDDHLYPFLGRPYVTNSILNTMDSKLITVAIRELQSATFWCIQLQVADQLRKEKLSLNHVLFGSEAVAFSKIAG